MPDSRPAPKRGTTVSGSLEYVAKLDTVLFNLPCTGHRKERAKVDGQH